MQSGYPYKIDALHYQIRGSRFSAQNIQSQAPYMCFAKLKIMDHKRIHTKSNKYLF